METEIILVDDDANLLKMMELILVRGRYKVTTATNISQTLKLFEEGGGKYTLAILDETLPDGRGSELAVWLKALNPNLKVLILSGQYLETPNTELPFLGKPFWPAGLIDAVRKILDSK